MDIETTKFDLTCKWVTSYEIQQWAYMGYEQFKTNT